ncbi:unnamed protein product [Penicillium roqueforti FM164]|uniref:Uncharacterized protein n=1 Tax=Penicillium roqueforti (strain FM164) TaxID=1365484 RepID=W6R6N9_PENRF|nr:unnamed protein product [Penicillium roqueforti FM164]
MSSERSRGIIWGELPVMELCLKVSGAADVLFLLLDIIFYSCASFAGYFHVF